MTLLGLVAMITMTARAQQHNVTVLAKGQGMWMPKPVVTVDQKTHKTVAVWTDTENNSWHKNMGTLTDVPVITNFNELFPSPFSVPANSPYIPTPWQLTEEHGETVLHCYLEMPADIVNNLWLASDETATLDIETGVTYRARRTIPDCFGKVFNVESKEGQMLDLQVVFPQLPETTKRISIYGIPNWYMRGMEVPLFRAMTPANTFNGYDAKPQFHQPRLVTKAKDYSKDNHLSWAVYKDAHLIKPIKEGTYALWLTPEATYLAEACEMNWNREYFGRGGNAKLLDQSGHQYACKEVIGYPNDKMFWNEGLSGDYFAIVCVFEPLPLTLENVTLVVPEGEPFAMWGATWGGKVLPMNILDMRKNQPLFDYFPRQSVK